MCVCVCVCVCFPVSGVFVFDVVVVFTPRAELVHCRKVVAGWASCYVHLMSPVEFPTDKRLTLDACTENVKHKALNTSTQNATGKTAHNLLLILV